MRTFDDLRVIERDSLLMAICSSSQHIDLVCVWRNPLKPPDAAIASRIVVDDISGNDPGRPTRPRILYFLLLIACTITVTSGLERKAGKPLAIAASSSFRFFPACLNLTDQRQGDFPVGAHRNLMRDLWLLPHIDGDHVLITITNSSMSFLLLGVGVFGTFAAASTVWSEAVYRAGFEPISTQCITQITRRTAGGRLSVQCS